MKQYPKSSKLIFNVKVEKFRTIEKIWINILIKIPEIKHRTDIGKEYFECDPEVIYNKMRCTVKRRRPDSFPLPPPNATELE